VRTSKGLFTLAILVASACGDDPTMEAADAGSPDAAYMSCLPTCAGSRAYDVGAYRLRGSFDWTARQLTAEEDVTLTLSGGASAVVELDSAVNVLSVKANGLDLPYVADTATGRLRVDLGPLAPGTAPVGFTVAYTAGNSDSLKFSGPRDDDPVTARLVYTDSEPNRGHRWLVGNHHPADRATFDVELTVPVGEDVIANGRRVSDQMTSAGRLVVYQMEDAIPTYLMAFAAGNLVHTDRNSGRIPLAVWHRQGLVVDAEANLDVMQEAMDTFEALLGPYPFDSYAVVLVPQYGGGMENATITFNNELSGQGTPSVSLHAHELGHQWFGDWVTMETYDDVWVKEGMATILAAEAQRARRDTEMKGRLMGTDFSFSSSDAIVDVSLTGLAKYTSGPYERAAWTMNQIRKTIGEDAFWAGCRKVLQEHALGTVDGETFVRAFAPALSEPLIQKVLAALPKTDVPGITIGATPVAGGTNLSLIVADPGGTLIAPIVVIAVDASGDATSHELGLGQTIIFIEAGGYVAPDEAGVHPYWTNSFDVDEEDYFNALVPFLIPTSAAALDAYGTRSASHQERAASVSGMPPLSAAAFTTFYGTLDSPIAKRESIWDACFQLQSLAPGVEADELRAALAPLVVTPPSLVYTTRNGRCGTVLAASALAAELTSTAGMQTPAAHRRLEYLIAFDYGPSTSLTQIGQIAITSHSLRLRDQALSRLSSQTSSANYSDIEVGDLPAWRSFFRDQLDGVTSRTRFNVLWNGLRNLNDVSALPAIAGLLHMVPLSSTEQRNVVCAAHAMTGGDANWTAFQNAAQPWNTLASAAQTVLATPATCPN
jgi:hypothetical protein